MNLNGIGSLHGMLRPSQAEPRTRVESGNAHQPVPAPTTAPTRPAREVNPAELSQTLPLEPPPGTDPELWAVLSSEERAFFAKVGSMGPLTYGHLLNSARTDQPVMRGGRLDVKA
ncbi:MAG TPA: hypothetical protein VF167_06235 [Longimicrobiaceae bacterium]